VATANGGRLPLGAHVTGDSVPVTYTDTDTATFWVEPRTGRIVHARWHDVVTRSATLSTGPLPLGTVHDQLDAVPPATTAAAARTARHEVSTLDRRATITAVAMGTGVVGAGLLVVAALYAMGARRARRPAASEPTPAPELATH
jgi:hypothetical protein